MAFSSSTPTATLDLYCWPAGDNDTLLIKTPANRWGLIDCGLANPNPKLRDPEKLWATINDLKEFLSRRGVNRLAFAQLSHPEKDHAKGMYELLRDFELDIFFTVPGSLKRTMLRSLDELIESRVQSGSTQIVAATPGKVMWEEAQHDFRLIGLGPTTRDIAAFTLAAIRKIEADVVGAISTRKIIASSPDDTEKNPTRTNTPADQTLFHQIKEKMKAGQSVDLSPVIERLTRLERAGGSGGGQPSYNRLSIITLGLFGQARVLLGADALAFSWRELTKSQRYSSQNPIFRDPKAQAFKVPHHGASDGLPLELVPTFVQEGGVSLISSSGHGFTSPSKEMLEGLTSLNRTPYCTGRSAWCPGQLVGRPCCGLIQVKLAPDGTIDIRMEKSGRLNHPVRCLPPAKANLTHPNNSW